MSVHHDVLKNKIKNVIPDKDILNLLLHIIDSFEYSPNRGIPMGNQTSQLFALYYLDPIDRFIKEQLNFKYYIRYMDDMILIHHNKEFLKSSLAKISNILETDLKLKLNNKTKIFPIKNGVDFLGFHFYITDSGKIIKKLRKSSKYRLKNNLKKLKNYYFNNIININNINMSFSSYFGYLKHGNTYNLRKKLFYNTSFIKK